VHKSQHGEPAQERHESGYLPHRDHRRTARANGRACARSRRAPGARSNPARCTPRCRRPATARPKSYELISAPRTPCAPRRPLGRIVSGGLVARRSGVRQGPDSRHWRHGAARIARWRASRQRCTAAPGVRSNPGESYAVRTSADRCERRARYGVCGSTCVGAPCDGMRRIPGIVFFRTRGRAGRSTRGKRVSTLRLGRIASGGWGHGGSAGRWGATLGGNPDLETECGFESAPCERNATDSGIVSFSRPGARGSLYRSKRGDARFGLAGRGWPRFRRNLSARISPADFGRPEGVPRRNCASKTLLDHGHREMVRHPPDVPG